MRVFGPHFHVHLSFPTATIRDFAWLGCLGLMICLNTSLLAQENQRCQWVKLQDAAISLDTLTILPNTLRIQSPNPDSLRIAYDSETNQIRLAGTSTADSILICYQVFPFDFAQAAFKRDPRRYDSTETYSDAYIARLNTYSETREEFFDLKGINKSGNITRGVSFGNNQNVFVNSALNLQLDGQLTDDISILAAISDQDVPFQPEGNTLQLQEFDRVFIKLSHRYGSLSAGDIVLKQSPNYFLQYYKNVQGGALETDYPFSSESQAQTKLGVAISKGKFNSQQVQPIEGVQGPYRLTGPNGERFIIVLANSEKVFIDGKPLTRGFNHDYVIDYNLAEITFNSNILITQFTRIRVDFEYSERNYSRSIVTASHYQNYKKLDFFVNFYRAADNQRNPLLDLSEENVEELAQAGDGLGLINGIDSIGFSPNQVLYKQTDTTSNLTGITYEDILVFSSNADSALFQVSFTEVGPNQGDYRRANTTINGQVYEWVEPVNGIPQGNFAPLRLVPTPTLRQMITAGLSYKLSEKDKIYAEVALADQDLNRFSEIDNADNQGQAIKVGYVNEGREVSFWEGYQWFGHIDFEYDSEFFRPIDRFRPVEFDRDWNISTDSTQITDQIFSVGGGFRKDPLNVLATELTYRKRGEQIDGWQHRSEIRQELGGFLIQTETFLLRTQQNQQRAEWNRVSADIAYRFEPFTLGYRYRLDQNQVFQPELDSVTSSLMNFDEHLVYWESADTAKFKFRLDYTWRLDRQPEEGQLKDALRSQTANLRIRTDINPRQRFSLLFTYRDADNLLNPTSGVVEENNILGRLDWSGSFFDRHIRTELTYATATGRELRREFVFLEIQNGQGTHAWRDLNEDGIQDLDEFFIAVNPDERNFIKVFVPTDEYINAFLNNLVYRLDWQAPRNWLKAKGWKAFLGKFSGITSWTINRRHTDNNLLSRLIPFRGLEEANLLSTQDILRNTLFFNQLDSRYGLDVSYRRTRQKQLLTNGFEEDKRQSYQVNARSNLGKNFNLSLAAQQERQETSSDFLLTRNYTIRTYEISPQLAFQPSNEFRVQGNYRYATKENISASENPENAQINQFTLEVRWSKISKRNLLANVRLIQISFEGNLTDPISYDLLEALQPGTNWAWTLNWQQRLANGLQLTLNYEGRRSENSPTVHLARMQLTALF